MRTGFVRPTYALLALLTMAAVVLSGCPSKPAATLEARFQVYPSSGVAPLTVAFVDRSVAADAPVVAWVWDPGFGPVVTEQNPLITYTKPGVYNVTFTAITAEGSATVRRTSCITVLPKQDPTASFTATPLKGASPLVVQYTDTSEPGTSVITDWLWDFGDSETDTVQNPQHTYANPGKYDVTLTVTTKDGIDTLVETAFIVVTGTYPPTASFTATPTTGTVTTGTAPLQVTFTDTSKPGTSPITAWAWDFGDGTTATTQSPTHIYDRFGVYTVSLTVTTKDGVNTKTSANLVTATSNLLTYGGAAADWAKAVAVLPDGGFALAGATQSQGAGGQDMVLVRTDASATLQWTKTFGGGGDDAANAMAVSSDGGFVLAGSSVQEDGDQRIFVVKTDADGNRVWSRLLGPGNADAAQAVIETSDGGFLVAGSTADNAQDLPDAYLVKLDASGNPRWSQVWADAGSGVWNAVAETASGGYVLAGGLSGAMALVATDASGKESWRKTYTPGADAAAAALTPSLEGGWILAGSCLSYQGPSAICVVRTDDTGNALWTRTYGGPGDNRGYAVLETPMRDIVVAGATDSVGAGLFDMYLLQLDTTGKVLATNTYGGARSDRAYALAPLSDGFAIAGETESLGEGGADMALVITGADGTAITYPQISR